MTEEEYMMSSVPFSFPMDKRDDKGNIVLTMKEWEDYQERCRAAGFTPFVSGVMVEWDGGHE